MGKPLVWTRGWTIVVAIWVVAAVLLFSARAGMGDLETFRPEDEAALDAVPVALMPDGETTYGDALTTMDERLTPGDGAPAGRGRGDVVHPAATLGGSRLHHPRGRQG